MKKITSLLLIFVFLLSSATVTYADDAKTRFLSAYVTTFNSLSQELKLINELDPTNLILKNLIKDAYEFSLDFGINDLSVHNEFLQNLRFSMSQKTDLVNNKMLINFLFNLHNELNTSNDGVVNFDIYMDEEKMAFGAPHLSDEYFYINSSDLTDYLNESEADMYMVINLFKYLINTFFNSVEINNQIIEASKGMEKPYLAIFLNMMQKAQYKDDGQGLVYYDNDSQNYRKTTAIIDKDSANEFLNDMREQINNDQQLRGLLNIMYSDLEKATGQYVVEDMIMSLSQIFAYMEFEHDIVYSIYTNDKNQILSSEIVYDNVTFKLDIKGKDYLLNNIEISMFGNDNANTSVNNMKFNMVGNVVPVQDVYDVIGNFTFYGNDQNSDNDKRVIDFVFKWDILKQDDNFEFSIKSHREALPLDEDMFYELGLDDFMTYEQYHNDFLNGLNSSFNLIGTFNASLQDNTISADFHDFSFNFGSGFINMNLGFSYKPVNSDEISFNEESAVNLLTLTQEQFQEIFIKFYTNLM